MDGESAIESRGSDMSMSPSPSKSEDWAGWGVVMSVMMSYGAGAREGWF